MTIEQLKQQLAHDQRLIKAYQDSQTAYWVRYDLDGVIVGAWFDTLEHAESVKHAMESRPWFIANGLEATITAEVMKVEDES